MNVAAILLAAGQSRRMGHFKPLLPFGEKTVIESCVEYLQRGGVTKIVVVLGHRAEEIEERLSHLPIRFAVNPDAESEMAASIAYGVQALPGEYQAVLLAPADHPAIPDRVVAALIDTWETSSAKLAVPEYGGRGGHPVLVDLSFQDQLLHLDPERGLRGLFDAYREQIARVTVDSPFIARDMDTWEDYRKLYLDVFGTEPPQPARG